MFRFKITSNKTLSRYSINETIYVGENKISWLYFLVGNKIGIYDTENLNFELQVIFSDNRYMSFKIDFKPKTNKASCEEYEGRLPITNDLTGKAQELKLIVRITDDEENVIGVTNPVSLNVEETESPTQEILPRDELDEKLKELQEELSEKQAEITDLLSKIETDKQTIERLNSDINDVRAEMNVVNDNYNTQLERANSLTSDLKGLIQRDISEIAIPDSITSIGNWVFYQCTNLQNVTMPNSVTSIGGSAFEGCTSLKDVTIPSNVTSIGRSAFYGCTNLTSITIPDKVTSIGYLAFYHCTSLKSVTIPNSVTSISDEAFRECTSLTDVTIPNSVTIIGNIFYKSANLKNVVIETGFNANGLNLSSSDKYTVETIVSWLNALADRTDLTPYSLIIGETNLAKLNPEQIAIATNKNWNLA